MAGSLLAGLGGDANSSVVDFATMSAEDIDDTMRNGWVFSDREVGPEDGDGMMNINQTPNPMIRGGVRAPHSAARIWAGIAWYRQQTVVYESQQDAAATKYRKAKLDLQKKGNAWIADTATSKEIQWR